MLNGLVRTFLSNKLVAKLLIRNLVIAPETNQTPVLRNTLRKYMARAVLFTNFFNKGWSSYADKMTLSRKGCKSYESDLKRSSGSISGCI